MNKQPIKKLTLRRETVRNLNSPSDLRLYPLPTPDLRIVEGGTKSAMSGSIAASLRAATSLPSILISGVASWAIGKSLDWAWSELTHMSESCPAPAPRPSNTDYAGCCTGTRGW